MSTHETIRTADGAMPCIDAHPTGTTRGAVVVVQEAFGLTGHIESICDRLAGAGWRAVAPALFHRQGSPIFAYGDFEATKPVMGQLTAEGLSTDIDATFDRLADSGHPAEHSGIVGFCMGGIVALHAAVRRPLGAAVTFYGGGIAQGRFGLPAAVVVASGLQAPWLGFYGDRDKGIPVDEVEALRAAAAGASVATEIVRYPEAEHGFNCDDRASYHPWSAADAWTRTLAFFDDHLA